jgi:predicted ester cyclase
VDARVQAIRSAVAAFNAGDIDRYFTYFADTAVRWFGGAEEPSTAAQVRASIASLRAGFDPVRLEEDLLFGDGNFVCARWRLVGTHVGEYLGAQPTGRNVTAHTCEIYEFDDKLVVRTWIYSDPQELIRQLGSVT